MCGITGYLGPKKAAEILLSGLARLEYRGYDSAGVAIVNKGEIQLMKRVRLWHTVECEGVHPLVPVCLFWTIASLGALRVKRGNWALPSCCMPQHVDRKVSDKANVTADNGLAGRLTLAAGSP